MKPLSPVPARLLAMLEDANGVFVAGQALANAVGIPFTALAYQVTVIRMARPDLAIEGQRGSGYRIAVPEAEPAPPAFDPPHKPRAGGGRIYRQDKPMSVPMHVRMQLVKAMFDVIAPRLAEMIKVVALETGETGDETVTRLLSYGLEVHHDLIASGENPMNLPAPKIMAQGSRA